MTCIVCQHLARSKARFDSAPQVNLASEVYNSLMFGLCVGLGHRTPATLSVNLCKNHATKLLKGVDHIKVALPDRDIFLVDPKA